MEIQIRYFRKKGNYKAADQCDRTIYSTGTIYSTSNSAVKYMRYTIQLSTKLEENQQRHIPSVPRVADLTERRYSMRWTAVEKLPVAVTE